MTTSPKQGQWGLYPWFEDRGAEDPLVHPEDLEAIRQLRPYGKVFECVGEEAGYFRLSYGEVILRVKADLFKPIATPKFRMGAVVTLQKDQRQGRIIKMSWHHGKGEVMYFLDLLNGKKSTRRFWDSDFTPSC